MSPLKKKKAILYAVPKEREAERNLAIQENAILLSLIFYQAGNDSSFRRIKNLSIINILRRKIWS